MQDTLDSINKTIKKLQQTRPQKHDKQEYVNSVKDCLVNLVSVDLRRIELEQAKQAELDNAISILGSDLDKYSKNVYCCKTGKPLVCIPVDTIQRMVKAHGPRKAEFALKQYTSSQFDLTWIYSDSDALAELTKTDPVGYFVYASNILFMQDCNSNHPEAFDRVQAKGTLYQSAIGQDIVLIRQANELLRRLLGLAAPDKINAERYFLSNELQLAEIANSKENLKYYIQLLGAIITRIVAKFIGDKPVTRPTIANLKAEFSGYTAFHQQVKIKNLSQSEAILYDLRGFFEAKSPEQVRAIVGISISEVAAELNPEESALPTIDPSKPMQLKLKPSGNRSEQATAKLAAKPFKFNLSKS